MSKEHLFPRIKTVGLNGILVQFSNQLDEASNRAALAFSDTIKMQKWDCIEEVSATLVSTFMRFDIRRVSHDDLIKDIDAVLRPKNWFEAPLPLGRRHFEIPCVFGGEHGPQFNDAADAAGLSACEALNELTSVKTRVMTIGFAPGQPYLGQLDQHWDIPRLSNLTAQVPQGALIVAIRQLIIFSAPNPTGWRHIGQTAFACFRPDQTSPFALRSGDEISLRDISANELFKIKAKDHSGNGGAHVKALT